MLMVRIQMEGETWWCLPGGAVDPGETPEQAALRELQEECCVQGTIVRQTSYQSYAEDDQTITFLVDIRDLEPKLGSDPELGLENQILAEMRWLPLNEVPERDRAFLWAAGLLGIPEFWEQVYGWGDEVSCPGEIE